MFLIFNKVIGTGIFSTPSTVFAATGSVGLCLVLWLAGGLIVLCGLSVFLEFGMAIPRSGGPKNYVERVYRRPRYLASCLVAAHSVLLGFSSANSLSFGRYTLRAVTGAKEGRLACACRRRRRHHLCRPRPQHHAQMGGQAVQNTRRLQTRQPPLHRLFWLRRPVLPSPCAQPAQLRPRLRLRRQRQQRQQRRRRRLRLLHGPAQCHLQLQRLGEFDVRHGGVQAAGQDAGHCRADGHGCVSVLYLLANIAYFTVIPKQQLAASEVLFADIFFRNMFGEGAAARVLPTLVALSNLGNILATSFTVSRITQELAKEGLLPFSRFWASNRPFNTPASSFFLYWLITVIVLVIPPPGRVYTLIINSYGSGFLSRCAPNPFPPFPFSTPTILSSSLSSSVLKFIPHLVPECGLSGPGQYVNRSALNFDNTSYATAWVNLSVVAGLIWLQHRKSEQWTSPWTTYLPVSLVFLAANLLLVTAPLVPPRNSPKQGEYSYYIFPLIGVGTFSVAAFYWLLWRKIIPYFSGQRLVSERTFDEHGVEVVRYHKLSSAPRSSPP